MAARSANRVLQTPAQAKRARRYDLPDCPQRMIATNTIFQIDIAKEFTRPHIAAAHPSTPNLDKANESRPRSSGQTLFQQPARALCVHLNARGML
jgi:hypothetical protein